MTEKQRTELVNQLGVYITRQLETHDADVGDALSVLGKVTNEMIIGMCEVIGADAEELRTDYCNALQLLFNKKKRHFTTGDKDVDEQLQMAVAEIKNGGDIAEIVDKYAICETPERRQDIIDSMTEIRSELDNVTIGYEDNDTDRSAATKKPVLTKSMADEIEEMANELLKDLMEEGSDPLPRPVILTIAIVALKIFTGEPVEIHLEK